MRLHTREPSILVTSRGAIGTWKQDIALKSKVSVAYNFNICSTVCKSIIVLHILKIIKILT